MNQPDTKNSLLNQEIAKQLRALRGAHKLTLDALSAMSGVSLSTLKRNLNGAQDIPISDAAAIAGVMGKTVEQLMKTALDEIGGQEVALQDVLGILAERRALTTAVSPVSDTTDELADRRRRQAEAASMTVEELERQPHAATRDSELDADEPDAP